MENYADTIIAYGFQIFVVVMVFAILFFFGFTWIDVLSKDVFGKSLKELFKKKNKNGQRGE